MDYNKDPIYLSCLHDVKEFFLKNPDGVYYSRQIEVQFEQTYFHWITNRALRELADSETLKSLTCKLSFGGIVKLYFHKSNRYYKRGVKRVIELVEAYSHSDVTRSVGDTGELLVVEAFCRNGFNLLGTEINSHNKITWEDTGHDLDFLFERDGQYYGVEVKNTLSYMEKKEFNIKVAMCRHLNLRPLFINRFFPASWTKVLQIAGGYALTMKYQLYPRGFKSLVEDIQTDLGLPVDCPARIKQGTIDRVLNWHKKL